MITVGFPGLMLNYVLYRAQLLPRVLGLWGLVGYAVILCGSVLEAMGCYEQHCLTTLWHDSRAMGRHR